MKRVLSISLGSSKRNHKVKTEILGEKFVIERRGTDGDKDKARGLFTKLDGQYDVFGIGGIDLYIYSGGKRYTFRDARKLIKNVKKTPVVDGSGLKNTLERKVINYLHKELGFCLGNKKVLMVSGVDRFGMAETFNELGSDLILGDLIFGLGVPVPLRSIKSLEIVARLVAPLITKLPFEYIYPTGNKQDNVSTTEKYVGIYQEADIIAGDYHFIRHYMPNKLDDKIIITNTVTEKNIRELKERGIKMLITTTPELNGRSFGTNVMEGVLVALAETTLEELTGNDYLKLLEKINFTPRVIDFGRNVAS